MQPTTSLTANPLTWDSLPAVQQPNWHDHSEYRRVSMELAAARPLVTESEVGAAARALAEVAAGDARALQIGDCAESFADAYAPRTAAKVAVLNDLADRFTKRVDQEVLRFGRMAGQYAKPRSSPFEVVSGVELPAYRGDMVNAAAPNVFSRQHDPRRMLRGYEASADILADLRTHWDKDAARRGPWVAHEALLLDYEGALVRSGRSGDYLSSTHFPWIGERTRQLDHAHVALLASVTNPVGCKIGPTVSPAEVVELCELLDPERTPGRLTLIVRMGVAAIAEALPPIVHAVRRAGHLVVWLNDPCHGNTVKTDCGRKTRLLGDMINEATLFRNILESAHLHAGGLHLEVAADDVTECIGGSVADARALGERYESLCDPRLNPDQAAELIDTVF
ncbi:3-deoxy-7-phosphoheptulonate synthase [Lentzea tibetensis]|uniref:Phospho-2-dehydro-3-deoxyheptonate aldolase n=1 Tax=Lentzea tibetensis TaxID=2591470 RepID=A0A563EF92_9PSEU|nr:3-deoxy-7-phosphoheptulonate synthase [Lentzea tibetensis]TWP44040.1 3-deoxy-7-phosphoheptulonate synthase [Lentzea tibetensis]